MAAASSTAPAPASSAEALAPPSGLPPGPAGELVEALRADARTKLLDLLDEVPGRKVLLLDKAIVGPLDTIINPSDLTDHGVQQWFKLSEATVQIECSQVVFLIRCCSPELIDRIAAQILADEAAGKDRTYIVVLCPRKTEQCLQRLNKANVRANVRVFECAIHFFPLDQDVLSMEMPGVFSDFHVRGELSGAFYTAKAIMFLQTMFGTIPTVHAIGAAGKAVVDIMVRLRDEEQAGAARREPRPPREGAQPGVPPVAPRRPTAPAAAPGCGAGGAGGASGSTAPAFPGIDEVIVLDRRADLFSVLCSQFTYQALIDMVYGITNSSVDLSGKAWAKERKREQVRLSADNPFYRDIRDLHINRLGPLLQEKAQAIQRTYAEKDNIKDNTEMAEYIKKFKTAQSAHPLLEIHTNLAQDVTSSIQAEDYRQQLQLEDDITAQAAQSPLDAIEDWVDDQRPFHEVMRLLCLYSLVNNGIKAKHLDQVKRSILQAYGYEHMFTLCNLEKVGLLRYHQGKSVWSGIKRQFNLFPEGVSEDHDISYAYSGYAPLSARLVELTRGAPRGWRAREDALGLLYGPAQELQQQPADAADGAAAAGGMGAAAGVPGAAGGGAAGGAARPSVALVAFVGGATYGELAALRRLSELENGRRRFLVLTTELLSVRKLFESLRYEEAFSAPPLESRAARPAAEAKRSAGFGFWPGGR